MASSSPTQLPTKQTAVECHQYGKPAEVIKINTDATVPHLAAGEVLINVKAVSVNPGT